MNLNNLASLGLVILAGGAIGWLTVGEQAPSEPAPTAANEIAQKEAAVPAGAPGTWTTQRAPSPRSAASDGGPDEGLPPPPPGIDVAADAMRRAQQFSPPDDGAGLQTATGEAPRPSTGPAPSTRSAAPAGNGWTPAPDSGWAPPADPREAGWGTPSR